MTGLPKKCTRLILLLLLFIASCSKSSLEELGETIADDLNNGPLGNEVVDPPKEEEDTTEESNDNEEDAETITGTMSAKVNGTDFQTENKNKTEFIDEIIFTSATISTNDGFSYLWINGWQIFRLEPSRGMLITLGVLSLNLDTLNSGSVFDTVHDENNPLNEGTIGSIVDDDEEIWAESLVTDETKEIYLEIKEIDFEKNIISGEFKFIAVDEQTGREYEVTDGVFIDLPLFIEEIQ